jgi:predicted transcriptional regulator
MKLCFYVVTPEGKVYSMRSSKYLKPRNAGKGYSVVSIDGKNEYVHRLVAEKYLKKVEGKSEINHKDGNKKNNDITNLEWCTSHENKQHAQDTGLNKARFSSKQKLAAAKNGGFCRKLTMKQAEKIRRIKLSKKLSMAALGKIFHISPSAVERIVNGKSYNEPTNA